MPKTIDVSDLPEALLMAIESVVSAPAIRILPLNESAVLRLNGVPDVHRDPFDRMLVCQAIDEVANHPHA